MIVVRSLMKCIVCDKEIKPGDQFVIVPGNDADRLRDRKRRLNPGEKPYFFHVVEAGKDD